MDKPLILDIGQDSDRARFDKLSRGGATLTDTFEDQITELFKVRWPQREATIGNASFDAFVATHKKEGGRWIYFPWTKTLTHLLPADEFYELRTARNNPLYTPDEQKKMRDTVVGVAGLSVGSQVVRALVTAGISRHIKIADPDIVAVSNLNRMAASTLDLGLNKTVVAARHIWEIDPYYEVETYDAGITADNLTAFLTGGQPLTILFDEVDDISLKMHLRLAARAAQVCYCMATDNGYQAEMSVARFDVDSGSGGMAQVPAVTLTDVVGGLKIREKVQLDATEEQKLIESLIGSENIVPEMKRAGEMKAAGKIAGWPQLQTIAVTGASLAVFAVRSIVMGYKLNDKTVVSLIQD